MTIQIRLVDYEDDGVALQGYLAYDDSQSGPRPTVLVTHQWDGRSEFVEERARTLAASGRAAFAVDMYGKGVLGTSTEENLKLMTPLMEDRQKLARRMQAGLDAANAQAEVDPERVAAIGYCFGGLCVLDLARYGAALRGVASFHGLLKPTGFDAGKPVQAKVLVMTGAADPMVPKEDVNVFMDEMTAAGVDWQVHAYGHAKHGFTVPGADNGELGIKHNSAAAARSWKTATDFLAEVLD